MARTSTQAKTRAPRETALSSQELRLLKQLKGRSRKTYDALVHIVYHLVELPEPAAPKMSRKAYLNDPIWKLAGKASSGRKNDDSAINHDRYLYGDNA